MMPEVLDDDGWLEITFYGRVIAKKNEKFQITKKDGKKVMIYGSAQQVINDLSEQVPGWARDMELEHPDIEFRFGLQNGRFDRDNAITTLIDVLVKMGTLKEDSVSMFNGTITIPPATRSEVYETVVRIRPVHQGGGDFRKIDHPERNGYVNGPRKKKGEDENESSSLGRQEAVGGLRNGRAHARRRAEPEDRHSDGAGEALPGGSHV